MKNVIIGTAGHIDHGKTTLIKALTGRDTDRLKEEKARGISIDLGFTYFDLPSGRRAGIIDVPGHEKFIKNMLAGVIGMDIVILVVAADEGVMPQTKEHLDILNMLDIKKGIVALTKIDLVEEDWIELVKEDIRENLRGTFLETSPIIPVSSTSKTGIEQLVNTIDKLTEEIPERDKNATPRLPVDRVFIVSGFGTVVTGTLISGTFKVGDEVQVFPGNTISRIRSIQVHGKDNVEAYAGQRVAINLAGLKKSDIKRGDVIAPLDSMKATKILDVKINLLKDSRRIIENRTRIRLYIGTSEVLCRVVFLDREQLSPGESCYAQLLLENEIAANRGDRFIIRFYSPMMTIGGGIVLESNPPKRKRYDNKVIEELEIKEKGDIIEVVEKIVKDNSKGFPSFDDLAKTIVIPVSKVEEIIEKLNKQNKVVVFQLSKSNHVIHAEYYDYLKKRIIEGLKEFHKANSLKLGMLKEELRSKYLGEVKPRLGETYINSLIEKGTLKQYNEYVALKGFEVKFNEVQERIKNDLENQYLNARFTPLSIDVLIERLNYNGEDIIEVLDALIDMGILVKIKDDIILHGKTYEESIKVTKDYIKENNSITVGKLRDILNTNRKYAIALLEDFDNKKITKRVGNDRVLY